MCWYRRPFSNSCLDGTRYLQGQLRWHIAPPHLVSEIVVTKAFFLHAWWTCPQVQTLWQWVSAYLRVMFCISIQLTLEAALLFKKLTQLTHKQHRLAVLLFTAAKQVIAKAWQTPVLHLEALRARMDSYMVPR